MSKTTEDHTVAMELTGDAAQVCAVLSWVSGAGMQVASVTVGTCHVELRQQIAPEREPRLEARRGGIYDDAMSPEIKAMLEDSGIPVGELQPAVGRR